jgi:hypothetical protein
VAPRRTRRESTYLACRSTSSALAGRYVPSSLRTRSSWAQMHRWTGWKIATWRTPVWVGRDCPRPAHHGAAQLSGFEDDRYGRKRSQRERADLDSENGVVRWGETASPHTLLCSVWPQAACCVARGMAAPEGARRAAARREAQQPGPRSGTRPGGYTRRHPVGQQCVWVTPRTIS